MEKQKLRCVKFSSRATMRHIICEKNILHFEKCHAQTGFVVRNYVFFKPVVFKWGHIEQRNKQ